MSVAVDDWRPKKKRAWHYTEIPDDPEVIEIMPGFEIQYMITDRTRPLYISSKIGASQT
jgi:hypothetical protein